MNSSARRRLAARGFTTGGFGRWLARHRVLLRALIAAAAVLWLFALRPLSVGDVLLVIVVAFVVAWVLELIQRRDEEMTGAAGDAAVVDVPEPVGVVVSPAPETRDAATDSAAASPAKKSPKA